MDRRIYHIK